MQFDDVLIQLGQFGKYQRIQYGLLCLPGILCAFHQLASVFVAAVPEFRCALPTDTYNGTDTFQPQDPFHQSVIMTYINASILSNKTLTLEYEDECEFLNQSTCTEYTYSQEEMRSSIVTDFNLVCTDEAKVKRTTSTAVYMAGVLVGAFVLGFVSDWIGRKKTLILCVVLQGASGLACGFAPEYYSFVVLRFLTGCFSMGLFMTNYVLGMELVGPKYRMVAGIVMQYFFALGYVLVTPIAYFTREWKYVEIIISVPSFIFVVYIWIVPESARWLLSKQRIEEAEAVIQRAAKVNKVDLPKGVFGAFKDDDGPQQEGFLKIFTHKTILVRSLVIFFNWCVITMSYYGLSLNSGNLGGSLFINFMVGGLVEFPAYTVCFSTNRIGRKALHVAGMMIGGFACLGTVFADLYVVQAYTKDELEEMGLNSNALLVTLNMIGKFGVTIAFCIIYLWSAELFPTSNRNAMMGISSTIARVGAIAAPYIGDLGNFVPEKYSKVLPASIFGSLVIVAGLLSILLPETSGQSLPETIEEASLFPNHARDKYGQPIDTASTPDLADSKETKFN